jgi:hypothetical protein
MLLGQPFDMPEALCEGRTRVYWVNFDAAKVVVTVAVLDGGPAGPGCR